MSTTKKELWDYASAIALAKLGLLPLSKVDGVTKPPGKAFATDRSPEARKAKRKYRKLWRRSLVKQLKEWERMPPRLKKEYTWLLNGTKVRGRWKGAKDPLEGALIELEAVEVGEHPSAYARGYRWNRVVNSVEYQDALRDAARQLGLKVRRSM